LSILFTQDICKHQGGLKIWKSNKTVYTLSIKYLIWSTKSNVGLNIVSWCKKKKKKAESNGVMRTIIYPS
jgi:hypothetical protein